MVLLINRKQNAFFCCKIGVLLKVYVEIVGYYINSHYLCSQKGKI